MRTLKELEKEEKDRQEFIEATNELKTELKKIWLYKMIIRLLDWTEKKYEQEKKHGKKYIKNYLSRKN